MNVDLEFLRSVLFLAFTEFFHVPHCWLEVFSLVAIVEIVMPEIDNFLPPMGLPFRSGARVFTVKCDPVAPYKRVCVGPDAKCCHCVGRGWTAPPGGNH